MGRYRKKEAVRMGTYLNPGNKGFQEILRSGYVDKTGMIELINQTIGTTRKLTCVSRPRRFGKSFVAKMLCAYYDASCDSRSLFDGKEIAGTEGYLRHLNQYHVVSLDITGFISEEMVAYIAALDQYLKVEELPSGKGIADVVYLPKRRSLLPALVIELKWNRSSMGAIRQIRDRNYPALLSEYGGETLLVGIDYDETKKTHSCAIEKCIIGERNG